MKLNNIAFLLLVVSALVLVGCTVSTKDSVQDSPDQYENNTIVKAFYNAMKSKDYASLEPYYAKEFLESTTKEKIVPFYAGINKKLGNLIEYKVTAASYKRALTTGTKTTLLIISSKYEKGDAIETLTIIERDGKEELLGWNIISDAL